MWKPCAKSTPSLRSSSTVCVVADELGDRLLAHAPGDVDQRLHDSWFGGVLGEAADELAVDLEVVERQVLEVVEGAEAGAEVVEGEPAAQAAQPLGEAPGPLDVHDRRRLGHLEDEPGRVDPGVARSSAAMTAGSRRVADRLGPRG